MRDLDSYFENDAALEESDEALQNVQRFWNEHIHDWKVARSPVGSIDFFREIEAYRFEKLHYLPRLVDFNAYAGKTVLDVGCGVGNDLSRFCRGGARVYGIDIAPHSIELATRNFELRGLEGRFAVMNGEQLDLPDKSFDLVYCHTVLHFTPRPERMIKEIYRVLKAGGTAIIMTVNRHSWLSVLHKLLDVQIDHLDSPIFYKYSIGEFGQLLSVFGDTKIVAERFPVPTKVHTGWKAKAFNAGFVGAFNALPKSLTRHTGHHLMAFCRKGPAG